MGHLNLVSVAAIFNQFVRKDGTLARMVPGFRG